MVIARGCEDDAPQGTRSLGESGVQVNIHSGEGAGDRTTPFGSLCFILKGLLSNPWDPCNAVQVDPGDREPSFALDQVDAGLRPHRLRSVSGPCEPSGGEP